MPEGIDANYHSHTFRCGHASGTDEEYIKAAIAAGYKVYGVSDHVILPHASQPGIRGDYILFPGYISSIRQLVAKYKNQITVYLGFEAEWYGKLYQDYYHDLLKTGTIDYLILGQHCFIEDGAFWWYGDAITDRQERIDKYVNDVVEGMASGLFSCVAHPDHLLWSTPGFDKDMKDGLMKICKASLTYDIPLEINMGQLKHAMNQSRRTGLPAAFPYPNEDFFEMVGKMGCQTIIGVDDHNPKYLLNNEYAWIQAFIKRHHLKVISRLNFKKVQ